MKEIYIKKIKSESGTDYIFFEEGEYSKPLFIMPSYKIESLNQRILDAIKEDIR